MEISYEQSCAIICVSIKQEKYHLKNIRFKQPIQKIHSSYYQLEIIFLLLAVFFTIVINSMLTKCSKNSQQYAVSVPLSNL